MRVGIIGGTGGMGKIFAKVFASTGHEVLISSRSTELTNIDLVKSTDLIIISVPIRSTIKVIEEITPHLVGQQILCDLTSLKVDPVKAMLKSQAEVIGLHPMFGPTLESIEGQTIIATPARSSEGTFQMLKGIFEAQGAKVPVTTPDNHDRLMAVIQGLTHFKTLVMAGTMRRLGISPCETDAFMSPIYRIESGVAGRILGQSPELYADILMMNPDIKEVLTVCLETSMAMREMIVNSDYSQFKDEFLTNREWFGPYCTRAMEETDLLIRKMIS